MAQSKHVNKNKELVVLPDHQSIDVSGHTPEITSARIEWEKAHVWAVHAEAEFQLGNESLSGATKAKAKAQATSARFFQLLYEFSDNSAAARRDSQLCD